MIILGLTGGLAMGKSTLAELFKRKGIPVHSADQAVHRLYEGQAAGAIKARFPSAVKNGRVDRAALRATLTQDKHWRELEALIHPLVRADRETFLEQQGREGRRLVVLDIPLLFETGGETFCDAVVLATAPPEIQQERALRRPGMTAEKFNAIVKRQMPDGEKRRRAHFLINTDTPLEVTERRIDGILKLYAGR